MEKIFSIKNDWRPKAVGRSYSQVIDTDTPELVDENMKRDERDKFKNIPSSGYSVKIAKSAKLTDTLSSFMTTQTPIVSQKLVELLQQFTLPSFRLIPIHVYRVKEPITEPKYFILQFFGHNILDINFKKSSFDYVSGGAFLDRTLLQFENYDDYLLKVKMDSRVSLAIIKNTIMKTSLQNDLFYLGLFDVSRLFITQRLKEAMEAATITGFQLEENGHIED